MTAATKPDEHLDLAVATEALTTTNETPMWTFTTSRFAELAFSGSVRSSEMLGFGPGVRALIINRDDFGMYGAINARPGCYAICPPVRGSGRCIPDWEPSRRATAIPGGGHDTTDDEFLTSPLARDLLRREGVAVSDDRASQRAWTRTTG